MTDEELDQIVREEVREVNNPLRLELGAYAQAATIDDMRKLMATGAPAPEIFGAGILGFANAEVGRNDFWQPASHGPRCAVIAAIEEGIILDLIAFDPAAPDVWFIRTGNAWALGMDAVTEVSRSWNGGELLLHPTPLDWLKARGVGACVVNWTDDARRALRDLPAINVSSPKIAQALRLELSRPPRLPEIQVKRWRRDAA